MSTTPEFSHIRNGHPCMVDIEGKAVTLRIARARAHVCMPPWLAKRLSHDDIVTKKGPVFQTAIIAGVMAAKQTSSLIPLCHPIALDKVGVDIVIIEPGIVAITCEAKTTGKTGVEMEALTGASVAALTVYDMCKALTTDMSISIKLEKKTGGKHDVDLTS